MIYFFEKVLIGGKEKIVPLKEQGLVDTLNVSMPKSVTQDQPVGSIFYTHWATKVSPSSGKPYYRCTYGSVYSDTMSGSSIKTAYTELKKKIEEATKKTKEAEDLGAEFDEVFSEADKAPEETPKPEPEVKKDPTLLENIIKDAKLTPPKSVEGFYVSEQDWNILVRNVMNHVNTMIIGPTGCGKTSVVQEICKRMGKKLHIFDMGTMIDPISSLLGVHRLEKGESIFDYAKFTQVIKEPCVILLDELSRAPLTTMNILFSCLDDRRNLNIEIACGSGEREIQVHPEVTFMATANVGAEYSGTNSMDRALVNRFFPLELGGIPPKEEEIVLMTRTGIDKKNSELIVKVANNIRSLNKKQEISVSLSIRETLMVSRLVHDGWSLAEAMEMTYLPLYEGTKQEGERSTVYKTISSY
jgi:MoxR-like ATPase